MPSSNTVKSIQYDVQSKKYIEKCKSEIKKLKVIDGDHGFV